jgi:hypothetical protein
MTRWTMCLMRRWMTRWMWIAIAVALASVLGCERKPGDPGPSCAAVTDHVYEVTRKAYPGHGEMAMGNRKADIARCEARKLTAKQRRCMLEAQTPDTMAQCMPREKPGEKKQQAPAAPPAAPASPPAASPPAAPAASPPATSPPAAPAPASAPQ